MSLSYQETEGAVPIAIIKGTTKIIYLSMPCGNAETSIYQKKCIECGKRMASRQAYIYHMTYVCAPKQKEMYDEIKADGLMKLPISGHEVIFITGVPGSGKTYFCNLYAKYYKCMYPEKRIILFTVHEEDESLDENLYTKLVINQSMVDDRFKLEDFADSLIIFDDIESSEFPKVTKYLLNPKNGLVNDAIKNGRHHNIDILFLQHGTREGMKTRVVLANMSSYVFFPKTGSVYHLTRTLRDYMGLRQEYIDKIMNLPTRWCFVSRVAPQYCIYEGGVFMIH